MEDSIGFATRCMATPVLPIISRKFIFDCLSNLAGRHRQTKATNATSLLDVTIVSATAESTRRTHHILPKTRLAELRCYR